MAASSICSYRSVSATRNDRSKPAIHVCSSTKRRIACHACLLSSSHGRVSGQSCCIPLPMSTRTSVPTDVAAAGGSITSSGGPGLLALNRDNASRTWSGVIGGNVGLVRSGVGAWTVSANNTYTGATLLNGGTTILRNGGALSGTSGVTLSYGALTLDNTGLNDSTARLNALQSGRVDVMNEVDRRLAKHFQSLSGYSIVQTPGSAHITFPMNCTAAPFTDNCVP